MENKSEENHGTTPGLGQQLRTEEREEETVDADKVRRPVFQQPVKKRLRVKLNLKK